MPTLQLSRDRLRAQEPAADSIAPSPPRSSRIDRATLPTQPAATKKPPAAPAGLLDESEALFATGHELAAACLLRMAVEVRLLQLCTVLDCVPPVRVGQPSPRSFRQAIAIQKRHVIDKPTCNWLKKLLRRTSSAAHGIPLESTRLSRCLSVARAFILATEGRSSQ